jgi:hypothetical protein
MWYRARCKITHWMPLMTSEYRPEPLASNARTDTRLTPGATPWNLPVVATPLLAMIEVTCVP